jgi:hypothetical protein
MDLGEKTGLPQMQHLPVIFWSIWLPLILNDQESLE